MSVLFDIVKSFFSNDEWLYTQLEGQQVLQMNYQGKNSKWVCYAQTIEEQNLFFFYSICPMNVPPNKLASAAEFISRANYGMKIGNFEMDYSDGEIRYKTSLDVENHELTAELISNIVYANIWTMDNYLPGLMSVIFGDVEPLEAIQTVESKP